MTTTTKILAGPILPGRWTSRVALCLLLRTYFLFPRLFSTPPFFLLFLFTLGVLCVVSFDINMTTYPPCPAHPLLLLSLLRRLLLLDLWTVRSLLLPSPLLDNRSSRNIGQRGGSFRLGSSIKAPSFADTTALISSDEDEDVL